MKKKIKYLDLNEDLYIEDNVLKHKLTENNDDDMSWDECWQSIIDMAQKVMNYKDESNEMRKR